MKLSIVKSLKDTTEKGKIQYTLFYTFLIPKDLTVTLAHDSCLNYQGMLTENLCLPKEVADSYSVSVTDMRGT